MDIPMIDKASKSQGILSNDMIKYLQNDSIKIDCKLALINAIGWNHKNKNSLTYLSSLIERKNYTSEFINDGYTLLKSYGTAEEQICYAYLKALDNYFDITSAFEMSETAIRKSDSYAVNMIHLLIKVHGLFLLNETCYGTQLSSSFKKKTTFVNDMRPSANILVFQYINELEAACAINR